MKFVSYIRSQEIEGALDSAGIERRRIHLPQKVLSEWTIHAHLPLPKVSPQTIFPQDILPSKNVGGS